LKCYDVLETRIRTKDDEMPKTLDLPPIWLVISLASVWSMGRLLPFSLFGPAGAWIGAGLAALGVLLMLLAVLEMWRARTTVIPHRKPDALVTSGVFRFSRNPIYLGDSLFLMGAVFWFDAIAGIILVPLFIKLIERRFIFDEEARLRQVFAEDFDIWAASVRRWV
jgi:protein-S-isoprenylcysteine O-methyltransferase Ste14